MRHLLPTHPFTLTQFFLPTLLLLLLLFLSTSQLTTAVKNNDFKTCDQSGFCKRNRARADRQSILTSSSSSSSSSEKGNGNGNGWKSPYSIITSDFKNGIFKAKVENQLFSSTKNSDSDSGSGGILFDLELRFDISNDGGQGGGGGVVRVLMDEIDGLRQRYNEASKWVIENEPKWEKDDGKFKVINNEDDGETRILYHTGTGGNGNNGGTGGGDGGDGAGNEEEVVIRHSPLEIKFFRDGIPHIVLNERGLLNMEHFRVKQVGANGSEGGEEGGEGGGEDNANVLTKGDQVKVNAREEFPGFLEEVEDEEGMWEETFAGRLDSKPKGPESLSLDITFPGYQHVFGIPEHASPLSLRTTRGGPNAYTSPYRLFNLDVFEYSPDSPMSLYGSIPFMQAHRSDSTVGVFWLSGSESWVDVVREETGKEVEEGWERQRIKSGGKGKGKDKGPMKETVKTHWMSESGILDLFIYLGPTTPSILHSYNSLTGQTPLPQLFSLAYHQCRWNYLSQNDLLDVVKEFDKFDLPMDVIWLDIEYAREHKYFIWDERYWDDPVGMQRELGESGRQLVAIVDPHIKRDSNFYVYKESQELNVLIKSPPDGKDDYEGWCWTGSSVWPDFFNPKSWEWWIGLWRFDRFKGSTNRLWAWIDMNEPSVFNGPEITSPKDVIHHGGWENRDVHNINGMLYQNITSEALKRRETPQKRPFLLSRSFFAGSQRYGAIWTGDNLGDWEHLAHTPAMLLANNIAGMGFSGADVGGFFGNPSPEMLVRWYQMGAFSPFFRAHAHIDTKRREPYLYDEPIRGYLRDALRLRYTLLPTWYTAFWITGSNGLPIIRPHYIVFPEDTDGFGIDDQFFIGESGLLVKPVTVEGATETEVYFAGDEPYYNYFTQDVLFGPGKIKVPAPLDTIPLFHHGGTILPRRDLVRRAAPLMWKDPITLVVAVDKSGEVAKGQIYLDDGESYSYESGEFVWRGFNLEPETPGKKIILSSQDLAAAASSSSSSNSLQTALSAYTGPDNKWAEAISTVNVEKITILGLKSKPSCVRVSGQTHGLWFSWDDGVAGTAGRKKGGIGKIASRLTISKAGLPIVKDWSLEIEFQASECAISPSSEPVPLAVSSSCPIGQHFCKNTGHISSCILDSRVDDGICDPECCDGSDETDGKANCPNRCEKVGAEYRKAREEEARKFRTGGKVRQDYVKFGQKEKQALLKKIETLEASLKAFETKEKATLANLERVESKDKEEVERKKATPLYRRLIEHQNVIKSLREQKRDLEADIADLSSILEDLSRDFNPNYQDMAVLGATRAFTDWKQSDTTSTEEESEPAEAAPAQDANFTEEELDAMEKEDALLLMDGLEDERLAQHGKTPSLFDSLPSSLQPLAFWWKPEKATDASQGERPEITTARKSHQDAEHELRTARADFNAAKDDYDRDWGREWEFKKLQDLCVEKDTGEYTYSVCFFKDSNQKSNSNNARTSLGKFSTWAVDAAEGTDAYYSKQVYDKGARCWNGPERSAKVDLLCGTQNALLSVVEPEKCEYRMTVTTPAVCWPQDTEETQTKDEL